MADEHGPKKSDADRTEYPNKLKETEKTLLRMRRAGTTGGDSERWLSRFLSFLGSPKEDDPFKDAVGIGLSGGGIRSATFCLGIFQGLARQRKLLSKIDYLSTVSGGGYFGAFYGRLFTRDEIKNRSHVEDILAVRAANQVEATGKIFRWLRENGRYLAPSGSGDVLLGGAAMLRNFVAVHLILWTFILMIFLGAQLARGVIEVHWGQCSWWLALQTFLIDRLPGGKGLIWWSPYTALAGVLFLVLVVPPAWCYWLVERPNRKTAGNWIPPIYGWFAVVVVSLIPIVGWLTEIPYLMVNYLPEGQGLIWWSLHAILVGLLYVTLLFPIFVALGPSVAVILLSLIPIVAWWWGHLKNPPSSENEHFLLFWVAVIVLAVATVTIIWGRVSGYIPRFSLTNDPMDIFDDESLRHRLSVQLRRHLVVTGVVLAFSLIDSIAQTLYVAALLDQFRPRLWLTAILGPVIALAGLGRTIVSAFSSKADGKRFKVPVKLLAGAAAFIIAALLLITIDAFSYAIAWQSKMPLGPRPDWTTSQRLNAKRIEIKPILVPGGTEGWQITSEGTTAAAIESGTRWEKADLLPTLSVLLITLGFSFLFGWSWPFLNRSGHQSIYTSRLIRAYLGASNPLRLTEGGSVTETIRGDDINQNEYWPRFKLLGSTAGPAPERDKLITKIRADEEKFFKKGMPLHLVNVTINETLDPRSNIEQRDRKGTGMAIGPAGISAGVLHHLVFGTDFHVHVFPEPQTAETYRVFRYGKSYDSEFLTLGNWTGVSGAAFSTSLGWRTSLPLSVLAGLANVRLTYWWNSGVKPKPRGPHERRSRRALSNAFEWFFSVQKSFFDELFARYRGTARPWWPLSDGGHFENLGGYELIRRRLPTIIIIDAEADPDYTFEGLSNLVRKARLDFGAEVKFFSEKQLDECLDSEIRSQFGTLEQLRRGVRIEESAKELNGSAPASGQRIATRRRSIGPLTADALSSAHAALAEITYLDGDTTRSKLIYIKPTLIGDEPADVLRYHTEHPSFPHESTLQQFFDEAQWESYRKLGEHISSKILKEPTLKPF
jgi:hypothetical protein